MKLMGLLIGMVFAILYFDPGAGSGLPDFVNASGVPLFFGVVSINFYNKFVEYMGEGGIDIDDDTFDIILMNSTHVFTATHDRKTDIGANEIPTGNGYTQGAEVLASITWVESGGVVTWDVADTVWTASGGPIPISGDCTDAVIYSETSTIPAADLLVCSIDFDGTESAGAGTNFQITYNASGIFTIS